MSESLLISSQDRVLRLVLNRPEKRNALNVTLCRDLLSALEKAENDSEVGAILLTGNGKAFCAGMDLDEALEAEAAGQAELHGRLFTVGSRLRKPLIAAVHGPALAGGTGLAANAHIVVASEDAVFGLTEIRIGLWPFLVFQAVALAVGERRTLELSLTGRTFDAREAERYGLAQYVTAECEAFAAGLASEVASRSASAIHTGLSFVQQSRDLAAAEITPLAQRCRADLFRSPEVAESIRAFREKRPPGRPTLSQD